MEGNEQAQNNQEQKKFVIPDPVLYDYISFYDGETKVQYTDCYEISMLRFLHLVFGHNGKIDQEKLTKFMNLSDPHCQALLSYFRDNPTYQMSSDFYKTEEGFLIRAKWGQFLNNCGLLDIKIKYQVKATVLNLLKFYKGFFPKLNFTLQEIDDMTYQNIMTGEIFEQYVKALNTVYEQLSFENKITCLYEHIENDNEGMLMQYWFKQLLSINFKPLLYWGINEFYELSGEQLQIRIGGHSDYRYQ